MPPTHIQLGMTDNEFEQVVRILKRPPSYEELAMYSVMWSEHCSYKSSKAWLRRFPTEAPWVVVGPGQNAGVVDLGDGWLAALRIESHNHPSFVEPYEGAATGVGGILRDIFTMGARPIAVWDPIRFGLLDDPTNRYLFSGVVRGIAGYGNAVGVPTVGGEIEFDSHYSGNPLVNVMALGLMKKEQLVLATASEKGNLAVLLGAATGRDGIGGVSILASAGFEEEEIEKRPTVQIGDPFEEKKLIEACLELYELGLVAGIQDLGGAGISCATSECAANANMGIEIDLDAVHLREQDMSPAEILMSESQERMLAFVKPENLDEVLGIAEKWEINSSVIGTIVPGGTLTVRSGGKIVAELPAASLSEDAPLYRRSAEKPESLDRTWANPPVIPKEIDVRTALLQLLDDPAIGDRSLIYEQYDHQLFLNTVVEPGHDGSMLRIKGTEKAITVSTDGDGRLCGLDPQRGGSRIVYEAALNVAVTGAQPYALVDNLNFGNPERPEVMWQFIESIEGMSRACEALGIPVIGGNVSFYNETGGVNIPPTPIAGMLGFCDPMPIRPPRIDAAEAGMPIWLVGMRARDDFAASAYARVVLNHLGGRPVDVDHELGPRVVRAAANLAHSGIPVLHDISSGGLAVSLAEICIRSGIGARVNLQRAELFDETPHRFLAIAPAAGVESLENIPTQQIGVMGGGKISFGENASVSLTEATSVWRKALPRRLS